ncbi:MAG: glycosyltransferase family 39 protein [Acidobacteria bacterium]|nr:glycosyltransferase family 39 protein [Acidobacteriota bacterium]
MRPHRSYKHIMILLALCLPYCVSLGTSSIWDANEAFYAETPREMLESGDYLAPQFNFGPRAQKPPLTYWIILLSYKLFGVNEFAVRLPSALAAIGIILFSYGIARMLFGPKAALIAAAITATVPRIFILARRLPIDILLLLFLIGTLFFIVRAVLKGGLRNWAFAYLFAGLGFLTKGPVALIIPGSACILWMLCGRRLKLRDLYPMIGATILAVIILPWYAAIFLSHGWTYIEPFFLRDNIGRFASETMGPSRGFFYYFPVAMIDFFPWAVLLLCAFYLLRLYRKTEQPIRSLSFGLPLIWCVFSFVLFSLSKNKQEYYIAPIYPVAAIILSGILDKTIKGKRASDHSQKDSSSGDSSETVEKNSPNVFSPSCWFLGFALSGILLVSLAILAPYFFRSFMPNIHIVLHYAPSIVLAAGAVILIWSVLRRKLARCMVGLAATLWAVYLMCATIYLPELEHYRPVKRFCRLIEKRLDSGDETGYFRTALPSMVYYLRRPIFEEYDAERLKIRLRSEKRVFCILAEKDYNYIADDKDLETHILDRNPRFSLRFDALFNPEYAAGEDLFLISNRADIKSDSSEDRSRS